MSRRQTLALELTTAEHRMLDQLADTLGASPQDTLRRLLRDAYQRRVQLLESRAGFGFLDLIPEPRRVAQARGSGPPARAFAKKNAATKKTVAKKKAATKKTVAKAKAAPKKAAPRKPVAKKAAPKKPAPKKKARPKKAVRSTPPPLPPRRAKRATSSKPKKARAVRRRA